MIMKCGPEHRKEKQLTQLDAIVLKDMNSGRQCYAELYYMSCHGMYFEADCAFKSGNVIDIKFNKPPMKGASKIFKATVRWCMLLYKDEPISKYGVGVKYF
jgi:hypothetical protein